MIGGGERVTPYTRSICSSGVASTWGRDEIPLLDVEVGLLEAAVINLESYEGNEVMLCSGYELLDIVASRKKSSHLHRVHGIWAFRYDPEEVCYGSVGPTIPDGQGPELVS